MTTFKDEAQSTKIYTIVRDVISERYNQLEKWGVQHHHDIPEYSDPASFRRFHQDAADGYKSQFRAAEALAYGPSWHIILMEELHEALAEAGPGGDPVALREELVQTAAVVLAWIEDLDGRG